MPIAYSYKRFSSKRQAKGHSLERQRDVAEEYAALHKLTLDDTYHDLGVSGYRGANREAGALGAFLAEVKAGSIQKGSYLLVENLDRLSRDKVRKAMPVFLEIINADIKIVTLLDNPPQVYSAAKIDEDNGMSLFGSMMVMVRAHDESKQKGTRVKAAWDKKRESEKPMTTICPKWLKLAEDRSKYIVIQEKADIVQRIFQMSYDGAGVHLIAKTFNQEQVPQLGDGARWEAQTIARIVHQKSVFGTMVSPRTGIESPKYYPGIVEEDLFWKVQASIKTRNVQGQGRKGATVSNLFSGMCRCGECGSRVRFVTKKPNSYLHCIGSYSSDGKCEAPRLNYEPIESTLLKVIFGIEAMPIVASTQMGDPSIALREELADRNVRMERYLNDFESEEDDVLRRHIKQRMRKLGDEITEIEKKVASYVPPPPLAEEHTRAKLLFDEHQALQERVAKGEDLSEELRSVRLKLQSALQPMINRIDLPAQIYKIDCNEYVSKRQADFTGMREGEILVQRDPDYERHLVLHGPLIDVMREHGELFNAGVYAATGEGGVRLGYRLMSWGVNNSGREAEYLRQDPSRIIEPTPPKIVERTANEEAEVQALHKARATPPKKRTAEQVALLAAKGRR
jgi:DNA invertase Pin-like site-specific DNA recombinase